jgi:hypothetical protein
MKASGRDRTWKILKMFDVLNQLSNTSDWPALGVVAAPPTQ